MKSNIKTSSAGFTRRSNCKEILYSLVFELMKRELKFMSLDHGLQ